MNKNKIKMARYIFISLFLAFIISYVIEKSGYYEYNLQNKVIMTNEAMAQFEKDLADGKDVSKEDYIVSTTKDYTSTLTRTTNKVSIKINQFLKSGIESVFKIVSTFVEE